MMAAPAKVPPPPSQQRPTYISAHAIKRYKERIENVDSAEVIRRLRAIIQPHRKAPEGVYSIESRKYGPPVAVKLMVNETFGVTTVYPVTNSQITRAMKDGNWVPKDAERD